MKKSDGDAAEAVKRGRGRPQVNDPGEKMTARFRPGTMERMKGHLRDGESLAEMLREAVEREIMRRGGIVLDKFEK